MTTIISNPPYNMRWAIPDFSLMQSRFANVGIIPPESNANFAFILTAIDKADRAVFILPNSVLSPTTKQEKEILQWIIESNYIEAVLACPDNMFESTTIATCLLLLNKQKTTTLVEMIDMRKKCETVTREQNGQFGGASHTNRTYKKEINIFTDEQMDDAIICIQKRLNIVGYCKAVSIEDIKLNGCCIAPSRYIEIQDTEPKHREYCDIVADINRVRRHKNACKLTINETLARNLGFEVELFKKKDDMLDTSFMELTQRIAGQKIVAENYFTATKNKNEMKFENTDKEELSSVLMMVLQSWKQHIFYLNSEENRYLAEFRDALFPELMSGKLAISTEVKSK